MSTVEARKALRDFYKLQNEAAAKQPETSEDGAAPAPQHDENMLFEPEEEELTELTELDAPDADIAEFVNKLARESALVGFMATASQIKREHSTLASAQRELVNDNYKKLIQAAETLEYLSVQGDLAGLEGLKASVQTLADWAAHEPEPTPTPVEKAKKLRSELQL